MTLMKLFYTAQYHSGSYSFFPNMTLLIQEVQNYVDSSYGFHLNTNELMRMAKTYFQTGGISKRSTSSQDIAGFHSLVPSNSQNHNDKNILQRQKRFQEFPIQYPLKGYNKTSVCRAFKLIRVMGVSTSLIFFSFSCFLSQWHLCWNHSCCHSFLPTTVEE